MPFASLSPPGWTRGACDNDEPKSELRFSIFGIVCCNADMQCAGANLLESFERLFGISKDYSAFQKIIAYFKRLLIGNCRAGCGFLPQSRDLERYAVPLCLEAQIRLLSPLHGRFATFFPLRARKSRSDDCRLLRIDGPDMASQPFDLFLGPFA